MLNYAGEYCEYGEYRDQLAAVRAARGRAAATAALSKSPAVTAGRSAASL